MSDAAKLVDPVRDASRRLVRELGFLDTRATRFDIPYSQCHALLEIERAGALGAVELVALLRLDKSAVSRIVKSLVADGLVSSRPDAGDGRRRTLGLTAAGRRKVRLVHEFADAQVGEALATLRPDQRATVRDGLTLYARALERARRQRAFVVRPLRRKDDAAVGAIIREVMTEHGADGPGFAIHDSEVASMSRAYAGKGRRYWVVELDGRVVGGAGFAPLAGGKRTTCELRKMYFLPVARGCGMAARLLGLCLEQARKDGYARCYLETLESMGRARSLYEGFGFEKLCAAEGDTGHFACDSWYARDL